MSAGEIWGFVDSTAFSNLIAIVVAIAVYYQFHTIAGGEQSLHNDRKRLHWIYDALEKDDGELKRMVNYARAEKSKGKAKDFRRSLSSQIYNKEKNNK